MNAVKILKGGLLVGGSIIMPFGVTQGAENVVEMREKAGAFVPEEIRDRTSEVLGPAYSVLDYGAAVLRNTGGLVEGVFDPTQPDPARAFSHNVLVVIGGMAALRRGSRL